MQNKKRFGFATGSFYRYSPDTNKRIEMIKPFGCNAIELTYSDVKEFLSYEITYENIIYLRNLEYKSIHFPFYHDYKDDEDTNKLIKKVLEIGKKIGADHYTIHHNRIFDEKLLDRLFDHDINLSFENLKKAKGFGIDDYDKLLDRYPKASFVLDTTHALTFSEEHLDSLICWLRKNGRLSQVHLSEYRNSKEHQPLMGNDRLLKKICCFDVPIILEMSYPLDDDLSPKDDYKLVLSSNS